MELLPLVTAVRSSSHPDAPAAFLSEVAAELGGRPRDISTYSWPSGSSAAAQGSIHDLADAVKTLFADALSRGVKEAAFRSKLAKVGLDAATVNALATAFYSGKAAAVAGARERIAFIVGSRVLVDFDWAVNHVLSSDKLANAGESVVTLSLVLATAGQKSEATETVTMELSAAELDAVISQLEAAVSSLGGLAARQ